MQIDCIVIGGGPAGLLASASASQHGARVLLLDKGDQLGRKLAISGGGRCNVTNRKEVDELIKQIPGNGRFLYSVFSTFNNHDLIHFFEGIGVKLKEEDNGRMFPASGKAKSVVEALVRHVASLGTQIKVHTPVKQVLYKDGQVIGVETLSGERFFAPAVIIASGGKSAPYTGSTGDGYAWAKEAGHRITELFPTEVPLTSHEPFIRSREVQGLSLYDVSLTVYRPNGKKVITHRGDMIFTHFGLSGPAALRCSQFVVKILKKEKVSSVPIQIDLFPDQSIDQLVQTLKKHCQQHPKKTMKTILKMLIPERLVSLVLKQLQLNPQQSAIQFNHSALHEIGKLLKSFVVQVDGTLPLEKAFVTGGGVHIKEIHPQTMESKLMRGLYFCGEILDIHGYTGGYNITAAMCTGYVAGKSAAEQVKGRKR
jgi:predicted Rossmann fold flavoprotein